MNTFQNVQNLEGFNRLRCSESNCGLTSPPAKGALIRTLALTVRTHSSTQNCVVVNPALCCPRNRRRKKIKDKRNRTAQRIAACGTCTSDEPEKNFSVYTSETLFAKKEAGYTKHYVFYIQPVEKGFQFWGHGQEMHAVWPAARFHNHAINTGYTKHRADRLQSYK